MISASALNSELINKIAQDFAQATSLAVVVVNIHGDEISELFNFTPFCQLMRQHPQHSIRCRMSDRCGGGWKRQNQISPVFIVAMPG